MITTDCMSGRELLFLQQCTLYQSIRYYILCRIYIGFVQKSDCSFPDFSRTKLLLFPHFQGILFIFMWIKTLQNCLLNAEISYTMYSSILNIEWESNFRTLNFRCCMSWTTRKLTNAWVINSVIDICIFQVSITLFKEFSRLFHIYDHFQGFSRPWKFLH